MADARVRQLEEQLSTCQAQARAAAIDAEQANQIVEQRYAALAGQIADVQGNNDKLHTESTKLKEDLEAAQSATKAVKAQLSEKDAAFVRKAAEHEAVLADKRTLNAVLERREQELERTKQELAQAMDKAAQLRLGRATLDAEVQEAKAGRARAQMAATRLEQQQQNLQREVDQLSAELDRRSKQLHEARTQASTQASELAGERDEARRRCQKLEASVGQLKERLTQEKQVVEESLQHVKECREECASKVAHFEQELATSGKLVTMYKEAAEQRKSKCEELEGLVRELRQHMEAAAATHKAALEAADAACMAAEQKAARAHQAHRLEGPDADLNGSKASTPAAQKPSASPGLSEFSSMTELYSLYVETAEKLRQAMLKNREREIMVDQLVASIESKAVEVKQQQTEHERLKEAYTQVYAHLDAATDEKAVMQARVEQLEAQASRDARQHKSLEQQLHDQGQQVAVLLNEVQHLKLGRGQATMQQANSPGQLRTAGAVISQQLLAFRDIEELQTRNRQLLALARSLGEELERSPASIRAELAAEHQKQLNAKDDRITYLEAQQERIAALMDQLKRQRDTYRRLVQEAAGDPGRAAAWAAEQGILAPASQNTPVTSNGQAVEASKWEARCAHLAQELQVAKEELGRLLDMLRGEAKAAGEDARAARAEASTIRADVDIERNRNRSLLNQLQDVQKTLKDRDAASAALQASKSELERRLGEVQASSQQANERCWSLQARIAALEAQNSLLEADKQRTLAQVNSLTDDKQLLAAQLASCQKELSSMEEQYGRERSRLRDELERAQQEAAQAQAQLRSERDRAGDMVSAATETAKFSERASALEREVAQLRQTRDQAERRATAAEARLDLVGQQLQKAEARAALLESQLQAASSSGSGAEAPAARRGAELAGEVALLTAQLKEAQAAAAAARAHTEQYKELAHASDEALKTAQGEFDKCKEAADARASAAEQEVRRLEQRVRQADQQASDAKQARRRLEVELETVRSQTSAELQAMQAQLAAGSKERGSLEARVAGLLADVQRLEGKAQDAKKAYEQQVLDHAATVKSLNLAEEARQATQAQLDGAVKQAEQARAAQVETTRQMEAERAELQDKLAGAIRQGEALAAQNRLLHDRLEQLAAQQADQGPGPQDGSLAEVVRYLRHEKDVADTQLALARQQKDRLAASLAAAEREAAAARGQLAAEVERAKAGVSSQEEQEALLHKLEAYNIMRESNVTLRTENEELKKESSRLRQAARDAEVARAPLEARCNRLEAEIANKDEEVKTAAEQASLWQKRFQQTLQRYQTVDLEEYQRVSAERDELAAKQAELRSQLQAAQQELETNKAAAASLQGLQQELAAKEAELSRAKSQEQVAKKHISQVYNPDKKGLSVWKAEMAALQKQAEELQQAKQAATTSHQQLQEAVKAQAAAGQQVSRVLAELAGVRQQLAAQKAQQEQAAAAAQADCQRVLEERRVVAQAALAAAAEAHRQELAAQQEALKQTQVELEKTRLKHSKLSGFLNKSVETRNKQEQEVERLRGQIAALQAANHANEAQEQEETAALPTASMHPATGPEGMDQSDLDLEMSTQPLAEPEAAPAAPCDAGPALVPTMSALSAVEVLREQALQAAQARTAPPLQEPPGPEPDVAPASVVIAPAHQQRLPDTIHPEHTPAADTQPEANMEAEGPAAKRAVAFTPDEPPTKRARTEDDRADDEAAPEAEPAPAAEAGQAQLVQPISPPAVISAGAADAEGDLAVEGQEEEDGEGMEGDSKPSAEESQAPRKRVPIQWAGPPKDAQPQPASPLPAAPAARAAGTTRGRGGPAARARGGRLPPRGRAKKVDGPPKPNAG
ncbi:hypothetical protein WJX72_007533 [[Myrmecia] bisecta]|uniref:Nucleoprotein TPR n=1 Tax=[Myrmecia] bisecta TaxID=41462 RepID=A0AAW1QRG2_9CHLO